MSERFRKRGLKWQKLGSYEVKLNRFMEFANSPHRAQHGQPNRLAPLRKLEEIETEQGTAQHGSGVLPAAACNKLLPKSGDGEQVHGVSAGGRCSTCAEVSGEVAKMRRQMRRIKDRLDQLMGVLSARADVCDAVGWREAAAAARARPRGGADPSGELGARGTGFLRRARGCWSPFYARAGPRRGTAAAGRRVCRHYWTESSLRRGAVMEP